MKFTKKLHVVTIALVLALGSFMLPVYANEVTAVPSAHNVLIDGEAVSFRAFNIDGNNFFMLRDIAYVLSGTDSQFEMSWDAEEGAINLIPGQAYTVEGGEMQPAADAPETALPSTAIVLVDGEQVQLRAYNIGGNNFFMLRDLGETLRFYVAWDEEASAVVISTTAYQVPITLPGEIDEYEDEAETDDETEDNVDWGFYTDLAFTFLDYVSDGNLDAVMAMFYEYDDETLELFEMILDELDPFTSIYRYVHMIFDGFFVVTVEVDYDGVHMAWIFNFTEDGYLVGVFAVPPELVFDN